MPAASGTTEAVLRHNLRANVLQGAFAALSQNAVQPFLGIFAIRLGASNLHIALLSAAPALANALALVPGGRWLARFRRRVPVTAWLLLLGRLMLLPLAAVPLLEGPHRATALVALVVAMHVPGALATLGWQSLLADLIPPDRRGQALADRHRVMALLGVPAALGAGAVLDRLPYPQGYQWVFALGFALGLGEVWALARTVEAAPHRPRAVPVDPFPRWRDMVREVASHQAFRRYTLASLVFYVGWQMPWPLFTRYDVSVLGASNTWLSLYSVVNTLPTVLAYPWWARLAGRRGNLPALTLAALGLSTFPLLYALGPDLYDLLYVKAWVGLFAAGVQLLLFNALLDIIPSERRTWYLAWYHALTSVPAVTAPLMGAWLLDAVGFRPAFLASFALRALGGLLLYRSVPQATAPRVRRAPPAPAGPAPAARRG